MDGEVPVFGKVPALGEHSTAVRTEFCGSRDAAE